MALDIWYLTVFWVALDGPSRCVALDGWHLTGRRRYEWHLTFFGGWRLAVLDAVLEGDLRGGD